MAHEHQADGNISLGRDRRKRNPRKELRGEQVLEAIMAANAIAMTIALFLGGVMTGVIVVVALAVRREDRRYSLLGEAPDRLSKSARMLNGVGRRDLDAKFPRVRELVP